MNQTKGAIFNLLIFKMLYKFPTKVSLAKSKLSSRLDRNTSGFTLLEIMVVIALVGILSAIAAPSWLSFVARQRLNKANDTVFATLQQAQREARKNKRGYSVSFRKNQDNTNIIEYAIYPTKDLDGEEIDSDEIDLWKPLGSDLGINPEQFLVGSNLKDKNEGNGDKVTKIKSTSSTKNVTETIAFEYTGTLPRDAEVPLKIVLAIPKNSGSNQQQPSNLKRCVIVETFIGGMRTAKDEDCNKKNSTW